jgi:defect-in-organelle-trafficking protein DotC
MRLVLKLIKSLITLPVLIAPCFMMACGGTVIDPAPYNKSKAKGAEEPRNCGNLQKLSSPNTKRLRIGAIRSQSLRDTALSLGARGGLAWRAGRINNILLKNEKLLNRVFNFNAMLLDKNVIPPVLIEGRNTLKLTGTDAIRIADRNYQILAQAKFVTAPPTWREYLWLPYSAPDIPDSSLLPKVRAERVLWKQYVEEGWLCGIQQADAIFRENIGRVKRDYEGMIRYKTLLAQGMVSPPFVAQLDMGVTGGGSDLTVNDRVLRITAFPALQNDSRSWRTEITPNE